MDSGEIRNRLGLWCTGVSVVTTTDRDAAPIGVTLNSFTSLSLEPPLLLICIDNNSETLRAIQDKGSFTINILAQEQRELAEIFCSPVDRFAKLDFQKGRNDVPLLDGAIVAFECDVENLFPGGDHKIVVGRLKNIVDGRLDAEPLIFNAGNYNI